MRLAGTPAHHQGLAGTTREIGVTVKNLVQRLTRRIVSDVCYWICEHLEEHTERRTTGTILAAGDAVAVSWMLDWRRALDEDDGKLPSGIASALGAFSPKEWREVMSNASFAEGLMGGIDQPEWAHIRSRIRSQLPTSDA
jgi:hypothetical protein